MNKNLSPKEVLSIIQSGEGYNAEFKLAVPNKTKDLAIEVCGFANTTGGIILIGVDDNNKVQGANISNNVKSSIQNSLNEIDPYIKTSLYSVNIDSKTIWVIEVGSGSQKPYVLSGVIYVRNGPNTHKLTTVEQMRDFFQQSDKIYFDEKPSIDFKIDKDFDNLWFEEFRIKANLSKAVKQSQIIRNLNLMTEDNYMKNGGVLFFAKEPEAFIETASIRCIAFEGTTKTTIVDDKFYGGPLFKQYKEAMNWLKGKLDVRYEISGGNARVEHWEIPETVFKELIINSLSHRDYYDKGARITMELFDDRVEISNPGSLASAISPEEFGNKSYSRNPLIFGLFVRINMVEQIGSGVGRVKDLMNEHKLPPPIFKTDGLFTVILKRKEKASNLKTKTSSNRDRTIELIRENPSITIPEISRKIGITEAGVQYHITKLQKEKLLIREGSKKSGYWKLIDKL